MYTRQPIGVSHIDVSLSLCLSPPLSKINKHILWQGLKNNLHVSGLTQFKPKLFRGQLYSQSAVGHGHVWGAYLKCMQIFSCVVSWPPQPPHCSRVNCNSFFHFRIPGDSLYWKPDFNVWHFILGLFASRC